jgi:D-proline reductase (dithiol) PrdB
VGLIARAIEERGIPTVCVVMNRDITDNVKTPRALFVHFPYGAPLGPAGNAAVQETVVHAALDLLSATQPGAIVRRGSNGPLTSCVHKRRVKLTGGAHAITIEFCIP